MIATHSWTEIEEVGISRFIESEGRERDRIRHECCFTMGQELNVEEMGIVANPSLVSGPLCFGVDVSLSRNRRGMGEVVCRCKSTSSLEYFLGQMSHVYVVRCSCSQSSHLDQLPFLRKWFSRSTRNRWTLKRVKQKMSSAAMVHFKAMHCLWKCIHPKYFATWKADGKVVIAARRDIASCSKASYDGEMKVCKCESQTEFIVSYVPLVLFIIGYVHEKPMQHLKMPKMQEKLVSIKFLWSTNRCI